METLKLLEIIKSNSPIPTMNEHIVQAIHKVEYKGSIDINKLVEYLIWLMILPNILDSELERNIILMSIFAKGDFNIKETWAD